MLTRMAARGGVLDDLDPEFGDYSAQLEAAVRLGLVSTGGAWSAEYRLTTAGWRAAG